MEGLLLPDFPPGSQFREPQSRLCPSYPGKYLGLPSGGNTDCLVFQRNSDPESPGPGHGETGRAGHPDQSECGGQTGQRRPGETEQARDLRVLSLCA